MIGETAPFLVSSSYLQQDFKSVSHGSPPLSQVFFLENILTVLQWKDAYFSASRPISVVPALILSRDILNATPN